MNYAEIAEKLIDAENSRTRKSLLAGLGEKADVNLARALRDTYYASWTNEPKRVEKAAQALKDLIKKNVDEEVKALSLWVSGINDLTKGRLASAVKNLDGAAKIFRVLNREYDAAQTQVAKLYALALLGKYDAAIGCGEAALKIFEKHGDQLSAGKIEKNLGNIVSRQELHQKAERYYNSARLRFLKIKNSAELTMCENGLAMTYAALNDFRRAEKFYASALKRAQSAKMFVTVAEIEASLGNLALFRGRYGDALKFLELSRRKYEELKMPHQRATAELEIADIYLELNLAREAFSIYETISAELQKLKLQGEQARARANFGRAAILLNEIKIAKSELKKSARLFIAEKNAGGAAFVKLSEANLALIQNDYKTALTAAAAAEKLLERSENVRHKLTAKWIEGEALLNLGETTKAESVLKKTYREASRQEQKNIAQVCLNSMGRLFQNLGDARQAKKYFRRAIQAIENLRAPLAADEFRMSFLAGKLAPFENLARIFIGENRLEEAFLCVEKSRSRSLADALSENADKSKNTSPLAKKLDGLREELNWFYSRQNRAEETELENLQREAKLREKQIADLMRQIESTSNAKLERKDTLDFAQLQKQLGAEKTLIEFVSFDGNLSAFVVAGNKEIQFVENLAQESEILELLESLRFQFSALRYGAANLEDFMPELKRRADFYLWKLYEKLFRPLESFLDNRDLIIVPTGTLHYVPFAALFDGESYLIERRQIVHAPSANVWQKLAAKSPRQTKTALLLGFADEQIPLVEREIETLEKSFPHTKSLTGNNATFAAYTENAPHFDVLHMACHGQFRPENPLFSSLHLADGFVTVRDVCAQSLKAELVTLSACETGLNEIFAGEEILGLARGFLSAGASSLVLSLWTVNDAATVRLMQDFYENLQRGASVAASLKAAQNNFIKQDIHPYFWSPFAVIGR